MILLAVATNLPDVAITTSAALAQQVDVAVGNILGGIAIQTAVLAVLDAAGVRPRRPLTHLAASLTLGDDRPVRGHHRARRHRLGDYQLAVSDILGGNAFLPVLFLLATLLTREAVLPRAHHTDIYLTALGGLLTIVYLAGLVFRPRRQWLRMGPDSITVLILCAVGIAGLALIPA
ncbi:hypothetical protein OG799_12730 [Micromonospora sp. NBC_00898]|uniref:hypothetical protein n=1 Tax=Micromonospora sp. NBC_00898 TaxID=2975981 RepID=UPI003864EA92|nr:hypothetical protein OG799_12730 [Micromonospora sp. NBC_00898]